MSITIYDAVFNGLSTIDKPSWKTHQENCAQNGIFKWLPRNPKLKEWSDLMPGHVQEFTNWLRDDRGLKERTISNYVNPVRLASRWVQLYKPTLHTSLFVRGVVRKPKKTPIRYLMSDQIRQAMEIAKEMEYPEVLSAFYFGSFAGLRIQEIMDLTAADFRNGCIETGRKTDYSERLIPLSDEVCDFADKWFTLFNSCPIKSHFTMSRRIRAVLNEATTRHNDVSFQQCEPHQALRTSFMNIAYRAECDLDTQRAYVGHAPNNVMTKHYVDLVPSLNDMPRIQKAKLEALRHRIILPVTQKILEESQNSI